MESNALNNHLCKCLKLLNYDSQKQGKTKNGYEISLRIFLSLAVSSTEK